MNVMACFHRLCYSKLISLWFVTILRTTDGSSITWFEPPPIETIADNSVITSVKRNITKGSINAELSWNFTVTADLNPIFSVALYLENVQVATIAPTIPSALLTSGWEHRFNVSWIPEKATLIILNVTDDDSAKFVCGVTTFGGGSKTWTREIHVTVVVPPDITSISDNQTVNEGDDVQLNHTATGNPPPRITWTRLSDNIDVEMPLKNITRQQKGGYRCTANNDIGEPATKDVFITVKYPPSITGISGNITVNDTETVSLNCTADGFPAPDITWTRLSDNSSVPVTFNITGKQDEGYYRCIADNGIGNPATEKIFITVEKYRPINTRLVTNLQNNIVNLTGSVNLTCSADANPLAKYRLYREENSLTNSTTGQDSFPYSTSVNERIKKVTFSCTPFNDYGEGPTETINVTVHYKPANVTLRANTTENKDCSDSLWVNFTCVASEKGNPAVESYQLYRNEEPITASDSGTWNEEITEKGKHDYSCLAIHRVKNVRSSNNVTVTFNVLSQIFVYPTNGNGTVQEGGNVSLYCNISGFPTPTITWYKDGEPTDERIQNSRWLNFPDIKRDEAGNYRCHANNTCGERDSEVKRIDVQYKPENVTLNVNITTSNNKVCADVVVNFTCTFEDANPPPHTYTLFENGRPVVQNMTSAGVWVRQLNTAGEVTYSCEARNSRGSNRSSIITFIVEVPVNITVDRVHGNKVLEEGGDLYFKCSAPGFPGVSVAWSKVGGNTPDVRGSWLNFTHITRDKAGDYICHGNNTCGRRSSSVSIDVQYKPENVSLNVNITTSNNKVCVDVVVNFTCSAEAANPVPDNFTFYENGTLVVQNVTIPGVWIRPLKTAGEVTYRCEARNSIGYNSSSITTFTVGVPALVSVESDTIVVEEGSNVTVFCKVSGFSSPIVSWVNNKSELMKEGAIWRIPNIRRNYTGEYNCSASNACGNDSKRAVIDVRYPPFATRNGSNSTVSRGSPASFDCAVDGNPEPNITWYKGSTAGGTVLYYGKALNFPQTKLDDTGCYTCSASNNLGTDTFTDCLEVELPLTPSTGKSSEPTSKAPDFRRQVTLKVTSHKCENFPREEFCRKAQNAVGAQHCKVERCKPGSAIVDLVFRFNRSVSESTVISDLKMAVEQGKFDNFKVDPESIKITEPGTGTTGPPPCKNSFIEDENCKIKTTIVVVIAIVSVLVIVIVSGTTAWWVHRKRKCRKDRRTHSSECEEQLQQPEDNTYSQVNSGYAHSGPPSANGADGAGRQQAVPTYASVDKSKKKKKQQEEKPPEYATVDKSNKKKKKDEKEDYTYAEVDRSKKTSKKQQPKNTDGLVYADLEDFQRPQMPPVCTSPAALPPVKRPPSYEGTQYADITEFLKGDATLPKKRNSQGMEMQPQASAPANGSSQSNEVKPQGAPPSNGNSQGNEVKPQGANKDESGVPPKESKL